MTKTNLKGLNQTALEEFVTSLGEPKYRAGQIFQWLYKERASSFDEMTNLSQSLRTTLNDVAFIEQFRLVTHQTSAIDGTKKFLFELSDGKKIETVVIPPRTTAVDVEDRLTICVSSQVGCALDCTFCATASMGFLRNLTTGEILNQFLTAQRFSDKPITNIVFMGMGEPMLNYDNAMAAVDIFTDQNGFGISPRRITISTAGYANFIKRMADEDRKPKLALSLHSMRDDIRGDLMPINKKYNVEELISALEYYKHKTRKGVMLEYIVFDGVNDTAEDVRLLTKVFRRLDCRINLIPFHSIEFTNPHGLSSTLHGASKEGIEKFWKALRRNEVTVFIRHSAGVDIDAACGQLAVKEESAVL
ncbi:MAG: 23S rRNA (adenine(2503)-C(2))-methyltransferase RlmN [Ignavibacteriales bacterium]|nr:23S rRNA (adenine(2503)-C(2))-methyltransferase RlmN [Ignavibacteriales bacterium]